MNRTRKRALLGGVGAVVAAATVLVGSAGSQEKLAEPPAVPAEIIAAWDDDPLVIDVPCNEISDATTQEACWRALTRRFDYFAMGMEHRSRIFEWQHLSTRIIFVFVLLLVSAGLGFSYMQFRVYLRETMHLAEQSTATPQQLDTDVELSTGGLKVSSNVLGVIILALSLAFFYLYLAYVYPISDTF